jgi:hypothetical protein
LGSSGLAIQGEADESCGAFPFVAGPAASPRVGDATLLGSRLASSVSSTLDDSDGNNRKKPKWQAKARFQRVTGECLVVRSMLKIQLRDPAA